MRVTEELLQGISKDSNFSDGVILPDGDYRLIEEGGHQSTLMELLPYTEDEIFRMVPEDDSQLFWLVEKTGCVLTDYNSSVGMHMTPAQRQVFKLLVDHGFISNEYCDLSKQREKVHEREAGQTSALPQ